jgi:ATP cone domain
LSSSFRKDIGKKVSIGTSPSAPGPKGLNVLKRNGTVQPFDKNKLVNSINKAGATPQQATLVSDRVVARLPTKQTIQSSQLSSVVARSLSKVNPMAATQYTSFRDQKLGSPLSATGGGAPATPWTMLQSPSPLTSTIFTAPKSPTAYTGSTPGIAYTIPKAPTPTELRGFVVAQPQPVLEPAVVNSPTTPPTTPPEVPTENNPDARATKFCATPGDVVVSTAQYVNARAEIRYDGHVEVNIHIFNHMQMAGFHGGVIATFSDFRGEVLFVTPLLVYGVDPDSKLWPGTDDRRITRGFDSCPAVYQKTDRIDLWVGLCKRSQVDWSAIGNALGNVVGTAVQVFGVGDLIAAALEIAGSKIDQWYNSDHLKHFEQTNLIGYAIAAARLSR